MRSARLHVQNRMRVASLFGWWCLVPPPRSATDRLVLLLCSVGPAGPGAAADAGSSTAATAGTASTADKELEEVPRTLLDKAKTYAQSLEETLRSLPQMRQALMSVFIEELRKEFKCSQDVARRALNAETMPEVQGPLSRGSPTEQSMHDVSEAPRASPQGASGVADSGHLRGDAPRPSANGKRKRTGEGGSGNGSSSQSGLSGLGLYGVGPTAGIRLEMEEQEIVQKLFDALPDEVLQKCNHDVRHQLECLVHKYKDTYKLAACLTFRKKHGAALPQAK